MVGSGLLSFRLAFVRLMGSFDGACDVGRETYSQKVMNLLLFLLIQF